MTAGRPRPLQPGVGRRRGYIRGATTRPTPIGLLFTRRRRLMAGYSRSVCRLQKQRAGLALVDHRLRTQKQLANDDRSPSWLQTLTPSYHRHIAFLRWTSSSLLRPSAHKPSHHSPASRYEPCAIDASPLAITAACSGQR